MCICIREVASEEDGAIFTLEKKLAGVAARWRSLGLQLDIPVTTLDAIEAVVGADSVATKMREMLRYWIDNAVPERRTWGYLAEAVANADNNALAYQIKERKDYNRDAPVSLPLGELAEMLVEMTADWKKLARQLDVPSHQQRAIDNPNSVRECLVKTIEAWIRGTDTATLEVLIQALETPSVGNQALAYELLSDVDIFKQLEVPDDCRDKDSVQRQLDEYISGLK